MIRVCVCLLCGVCSRRVDRWDLAVWRLLARPESTKSMPLVAGLKALWLMRKERTTLFTVHRPSELGRFG